MNSNAQAALNCPRVNLVRPAGLHHLWPHYEGWVARALEYSLLEGDDADSVRERLFKGELLLVEIGSDERAMAVAVLEIIPTKEGKALHVIALAGDDMHIWLDDFIDFLRSTAKGLECDAGVTLTGRRGWVTELKRYGFEYLYCNMRMPL